MLPTGSLGRNVAGPFLIASSIGDLGSNESYLRQQPEHDPLLVYDLAPIPTRLLHPLPHRANLLCRSAGRHVSPGRLPDGGHGSQPAFPGEPTREPVRFAGHVVINPLEAQTFEPRRGPRAHVSLVVVAVDDNRRISLKPRGHLPVQLLKRDVDGSGKMLVLVLLARQHVHELSPFS